MNRKFYLLITITPSLFFAQQKSGFFSKSNHDKKIVVQEKTIEPIKIEIKDSIVKDSVIIEKVDFLNSPVENGVITSSYSNSRFHPVTKEWKAHKGTDFYAPYGSPILATAGGTVEDENYTSANGNYVKIKHDNTYSTQYLHMSEIMVRKGQIIKQGDTIGLVGSSGLATGPHVCYRFWKNGQQIDPFILEDNLQNETINNLSQEEKEETKEFKKFITGFFKESK